MRPSSLHGANGYRSDHIIVDRIGGVAEEIVCLGPQGVSRPKDSFSILRRRGRWRDALRRRMLAIADLLAVIIATTGVAAALGDWTPAITWSLLLLPVWLVLAKLHGLYDRDHRLLRHLTADELPHLVSWATAGVAAVTAVLLLTAARTWPTATAASVWGSLLLCAPMLRVAARRAWRAITPPERVLIVGSGPLAQATRRKFELFSDLHARIVGAIDEEAAPSIAELAEADRVDRIILAAPVVDERLLASLMAFCRERRAKLAVVPPVRGMFGTAVRLNHLAELPMVEYQTADIARSTLLLKRAFDVCVSAAAIGLLALPLAVVAILIKLDSPGPVLFTQRRAGRAGRAFTMFKLRTMVDGAERLLPDLLARGGKIEAPVFKFRDDPRVTRVGRLLRRTSVDEFPQLLNVLRGEMSLVGPRPEEFRLVARYADAYHFCLLVRPGLTGPMQVLGRGELTFDERLAVERDYVENLSLGRDVRLMLLTAAAVVSGRGAY